MQGILLQIDILKEDYQKDFKTCFFQNACDLYVKNMYLYVIRMSIICTRMSSVCHSYVLICHPYVTRIYSYVIRMSLVCHSYVIRMSLVCTRMPSVFHLYVFVCHPYVSSMWFYHEPVEVEYFLKRTFIRFWYRYLMITFRKLIYSCICSWIDLFLIRDPFYKWKFKLITVIIIYLYWM